MLHKVEVDLEEVQEVAQEVDQVENQEVVSKVE